MAETALDSKGLRARLVKLPRGRFPILAGFVADYVGLINDTNGGESAVEKLSKLLKSIRGGIKPWKTISYRGRDEEEFKFFLFGTPGLDFHSRSQVET